MKMCQNCGISMKKLFLVFIFIVPSTFILCAQKTSAENRTGYEIIEFYFKYFKPL